MILPGYNEYLKGQVLEKNSQMPNNSYLALESYRKAARKGHQLGLTEFIRLCEKMYQDGKAALFENDSQFDFVSLYEKVTVSNSSKEIQYRLGYLYEEGKGGAVKNENKAVKYYREAASDNHPIAQYKIALWYGKSPLAQDQEKALVYLKQSADQKNPEALYYLGEMHERGELGVVEDLKQAFKYFVMADEYNLAKAKLKIKNYLNNLYEWGNHAEIKGNIDEALVWFEIAASHNHHESQYKLGMIYEGKQDNDSALKYYSESAKIYPLAQYKMGFIYKHGSLGVVANIDIAIKWFLEAADGGLAIAQYTTGLWYENTLPNKGLYYLKMAAEQDYADALYKLGEIYESNPSLSPDPLEFIHFFKRAGKLDHKEAVKKIVMRYYRLSQFDQTAIKWYERGGELDIPEALDIIISLYEKQNSFLSINMKNYWYRKAADHDNPYALYREGNKYLSIGDTTAALDFFVRAAKQGHIEALFETAKIYELQKQEAKAKQIYQILAKKGHQKSVVILNNLCSKSSAKKQDALETNDIKKNETLIDEIQKTVMQNKIEFNETALTISDLKKQVEQQEKQIQMLLKISQLQKTPEILPPPSKNCNVDMNN